MNSREKYEIPDWVVDDYNSRVSEEDRLPLNTEQTNDGINTVNCSRNDVGASQRDYMPHIIAIILLILWLIFAVKYLGIAIIISAIFLILYFLFG